MAAAIKRDTYLLSRERESRSIYILLGSTRLPGSSTCTARKSARKSVPIRTARGATLSKQKRERSSSLIRATGEPSSSSVIAGNSTRLNALIRHCVFEALFFRPRCEPFRIAVVFQWAGMQQSIAQRDPLRFRRRSIHQQFRFGLPKRRLVSRRHLSHPRLIAERRIIKPCVDVLSLSS